MKTNLIENLDNGLSQASLKLSKGKIYMVISAGFSFILTYALFKKSPFFLFITWENFFIFYIIVIVLAFVIYFGFGFLIGFIKKMMM